MKRKIISLYILLLMTLGYTVAQETVTVSANTIEISDNLDLQAVASIFGDSRDLEDFENRLNDPYTQISNLDLNRDGYVDYLRVVELSENYTHLIAIQAVIGHDLYQDVATIEVERDPYGATTIQVVGDVYMYGPDYIIEPVYVQRPLVILWFWGPYYRAWSSPYYWGYYPGYYTPWHPYHPHIYRSNVYVHINVHHTYHYAHVRKCGSAVNMHHRVHRNDYGNQYPKNSFRERNRGITNRSGLNYHRDQTGVNSHLHKRIERSEQGYKPVTHGSGYATNESGNSKRSAYDSGTKRKQYNTETTFEKYDKSDRKQSNAKHRNVQSNGENRSNSTSVNQGTTQRKSSSSTKMKSQQTRQYSAKADSRTSSRSSSAKVVSGNNARAKSQSDKSNSRSKKKNAERR